MTGSLLRDRSAHEAKVAPVELFFDLVFVYAITQLSHYLLAHQTPLGVLQTALMFLGVWWMWIYTSWAANWLDPERNPVRGLIFALMAAALVLAMAIPEAWAERGLAFAIAYVFIQVGRNLFMLFALRRPNPTAFHAFVRISIWFAVAGAFWIAGGLIEEHRLWLWLAALAIEYLAAPLYFYVPGLGRSASTDWDIAGGHLAERCSLFVIIVLGESIIITGSTVAEHAWHNEAILGFLAAFTGTIAMWWIYFNIGAARAARAIEEMDDPGRYARLAFNYIHMPIIAGILSAAAGDEIVLAHPHGHAGPLQLAILLGGPALFLIGNLLFKRTTASRWPLSHMLGLVLLAILALLATGLSLLAIGLATSAILIFVAIWETVSLRGRDV